MAQFESKHVLVPSNVADIHAFLQKMENIQLLLPKDKISNWSSTENSCTFKIQNVYTFTLIRTHSNVSESEAFTEFNTSEDSPFAFTLKAIIQSREVGCNCYQSCQANINPFMEMMVKGPLQSLFDYMADRLQKVFQEAQ
jgi:hypothetical protein